MKKTPLLLGLILLLGAILRLYSAYGIPASGDETISLNQSSGKAHLYGQFCRDHEGRIIPGEDLLWFLEYSDGYGLADVSMAMEKAGMHPPLYYYILHFILKYLGNTPYLLRCVSILFSLGSIWIVYLIGKELKDTALGLMTALLFTVSTYGIKFSFMIRPYPMVMFISLLSAWVVLNWSKKDRFRFSDYHYWAILTLGISGFYSIYHFVFQLAFLWSFLLLISFRNRKDVLVILSLPVVTGLAYIPWIPSLLSQMKVVRGGSFYFYGMSNPITALGQLLTLNFTKCLPFRIVPSVIILALLLVLGVSGFILIIKHRIGIIFIAALTVSILGNFLLDLLLKSNTISVNKLAFFLSPVSVIFLAAGCTYLKNRFRWKISLYPILLGLAMIHSFCALPFDLSIDGPYGKDLLNRLNRDFSSSGNTLFLMSRPQRRYVFSLALAMESQTDYVFIPELDFTEAQITMHDLRDYGHVVALNIQEQNDTAWPHRINAAKAFLETSGYHLQSHYDCVMGRIIVLEKESDYEQAQDETADTASPR